MSKAKKKSKSALARARKLRLEDLTEDGIQMVFDFSTFENGRRDGYRQGIEAAASFVEQFDQYVNHDWLLSECILSKFNIMPGKPRRNKRKYVIVGIWNKK